MERTGPDPKELASAISEFMHQVEDHTLSEVDTTLGKYSPGDRERTFSDHLQGRMNVLDGRLVGFYPEDPIQGFSDGLCINDTI